MTFVIGLENIPSHHSVFHAGTSFDKEGQLVTSGGRVLTIVVRESKLKDATEKATALASLVKFDGVFYRKDIAHLAFQM